jgi:hypothetical protein
MAADAANIAAGKGSRHPVLPSAASAASKHSDSSRPGSKYDPGDKYKTVRFSDKDNMQFRDSRDRGGTTLPAYSLLHITCDCDVTDIDTMYRRCCISTINSSSLLPVTTSFINGQEAAWIESQQESRAPGKRKNSATSSASVSLAGTIYGSVVFNLSSFNEVTRSIETLSSLHAKVIDSCIDIIVGQPVTRDHHLVQKLSHYFEGTMSSKPYPSQLVTPVTPLLARTSSVCAQPCTACTPFVAIYRTGLANFFRDHVPNMTEMVKPLQVMIPLSKYQRIGKRSEERRVGKECGQSCRSRWSPYH